MAGLPLGFRLTHPSGYLTVSVRSPDDKREVMTREQMDQLIEAHLGAEDVGDIAAAVAVYTDDVEHDVVGAPDGPLRGPEAVRRRYEQLVQNMRTVSMQTTHQYYSDDACVIEHLCTCVITGQFAGIEGHGRQVSFRLLQIFEFRDGKISRENVWMDTATLLAQLSAPVDAAVH